MESPAISVIMPVYNTAGYLMEAVESVLNQTMPDFEFIIVNDGSTDGGGAILERYANLDKRIRLFTKKNEGSSIARSLGLSRAIGTYLYFMDSDDILVASAFEDCLSKATNNDLDILLFDAVSFDDNSGLDHESFSYDKKGMFSTDVMTGPEMMSGLLKTGLFRVTPWIHFLKKDFIISNEIDFYPGIINEDELFFSRVYFYSSRCAYLPKILFKRRLRPNSTMSALFSFKRASSYFVVIDQLEKESEHLCELSNKNIELLISNISNGVAYQSSLLGIRERISVLFNFWARGLLLRIKVKNLIVLLFPFTTKIKSSLPLGMTTM